MTIPQEHVHHVRDVGHVELHARRRELERTRPIEARDDHRAFIDVWSIRGISCEVAHS